jgi:D-alanyl-D-alanine carboxypeptidase
MKKSRILGLILFVNLIIAGMFLSTELLIHQSSKADADTEQNADIKQNADGQEAAQDITAAVPQVTEDTVSTADASVVAVPTEALEEPTDDYRIEQTIAGFDENVTLDDSYTTSAEAAEMPQLIYDCTQIDYKKYIPKMFDDEELTAALDIDNPDISIDAECAILFDAATKQVLYYKNPVQAAFSASTIKLLTSLVALDSCTVEEEVTVGDEITLIASDSTKAGLVQGDILTLGSLLDAMLLPSGNDAAYAVAAYVGRKSLGDTEATKEEAVTQFIRLMNEKAEQLGVKNSCFKTPDGYDAIGQYTTAYDMGLIGMAAAANDKITQVAGQSSARVTFVSGRDVTWNSTNKLIKRYSGQYYSKAIGLKTGTSTMAGRCIVAAAKMEGKEVVCVILDSTSAGRWEDAIKLLKYGLDDE